MLCTAQLIRNSSGIRQHFHHFTPCVSDLALYHPPYNYIVSLQLGQSISDASSLCENVRQRVYFRHPFCCTYKRGYILYFEKINSRSSRYAMANTRLGTEYLHLWKSKLTIVDISEDVQGAFSNFISNKSVLALPLALKDSSLHTLPAVYTKGSGVSFQNDLNLLDDTLNPKIPLYLLLRRGDSVSAITFVPFRAPIDERELYLHHRHDLVASFGAEEVKTSLICKEIGEITDARSWVERDTSKDEIEAEGKTCEDSHDHDDKMLDIGYKKNQCRLCDRRMKNKITDEALAALGKLKNEGDCVQIVSCFFGTYVFKKTNETVTELRPRSGSRHTSCIASSRTDTFAPSYDSSYVYILPPPKQSPLLHLPLSRFCNGSAAHEAHYGYSWLGERSC